MRKTNQEILDQLEYKYMDNASDNQLSKALKMMDSWLDYLGNALKRDDKEAIEKCKNMLSTIRQKLIELEYFTP